MVDNNPPSTAVTSRGKSFNDVVYKNGSQNLINADTPFDFTSVSGDDYSTVVNNMPFVSINGGSYTPLGSVHFNETVKNTPQNVSYYASDNFGNSEAVKSFTVIVDSTPPAVTNQISQPFYQLNGVVYIPQQNNITLSASDDLAGVKNIYYTAPGNEGFSLYVPNQSGLALNKPGENKISYYAEDNVGNKSEPQTLSLFLDSIPPYTSLNKDGQVFTSADKIYYKGILQCVLIPVDFGCGVKSSLYRLDGGNYINSVNIPAFPANINGTIRQLEYYSVDFVNNEENHNKVTIVNDETPPVSTLTIDGVSYTNNYVYCLPSNKFKIEASDFLSGVKDIYYKVDTGDFTNYFDELSINPGAYGSSHTIYYYSMDDLSNLENVNSIEKIIIDGNPPETLISVKSGRVINFNGSNYCTTGTIFTLKATDDLCGVGSTIFIKNGISNSGTDITIDRAGNYNLDYYSIDHLGNIEQAKNLQVVSPIPDTTPPVVELTYSGITYSTNNLLYANTNLVISVTSTDIAPAWEYPTGVSNILYSINGTWKVIPGDKTEILLQPGSIHILYYSGDNANNISVTNEFTVIIDEKSPITICDYSSTNWTNKSILLNFQALDMPAGFSSGVSQTSLRIGNIILYSNTLLIQDDGINNIYFNTVDNVSNREADKLVTVKSDFTPPAINITGANNLTKYGKNGVKPIIYLSDRLPGSGLGSMELEIIKNNTSFLYISTNFEGITSSEIDLDKITGEGDYVMNVRLYDTALNFSGASIIFKIDTTPPDIPTNVRHLFDGNAEYLEWDKVTNLDLMQYDIYRDSNFINYSTNSGFIDTYHEGAIHNYNISSMDNVWNESGKSSNEIINTSTAFSLVHPSTNQFYRNHLWIRADYYGDNKNSKLKFWDFHYEDNDEDNICNNFEQYIIPYWEFQNSRNDTLQDVKVEIALSNALVPTNFIVVLHKDSIQKHIFINLDLRQMEEGNYILKVSGVKDNIPKLEDAMWFGIDSTYPVTFLTVDSNILTNMESRQKIYIPSGSTIGLIAIDPIVNNSSSGVKQTYFSLSGNKINTGWLNYTNQKLCLNNGEYLLSYYSCDNTHFLFEDFPQDWVFPRSNIEPLKTIEIYVGNYLLTNCLNICDAKIPEFIVKGIYDYGKYKGKAEFNFSVTNVVSYDAELDGKNVASPQKITIKGDHRLRIKAMDKSGNIFIRDIVFEISD